MVASNLTPADVLDGSRPLAFEELAKHRQTYGEVSKLPTPNFLYGQTPGEEIAVDIEPGKRLIIKYLATGTAHPDSLTLASSDGISKAEKCS